MPTQHPSDRPSTSALLRWGAFPLAAALLTAAGIFIAASGFRPPAAFAAEPPEPAGKGVGVSVAYQLPTDGPLPKTYRVTLAIHDPKNPDWIVAQFARGEVRTVTAENGGKFTETWDGLDDNHMPVPPGEYGVKGICMPARKWAVDDEYHSITPKFVTGASAWTPSPDQPQQPEPFGGDPVGAPLEDVAVGPNGVAVFYYQYLENGTNCPQIDLKKPLGLDQFVRAYNSGGAGGGPVATTDGETVWAFSADGGPKFVYRADGKPFGKSPGANRANSYPPEGWVTAMAVWWDASSGSTDAKRFVYVAQRGKIEHGGRKKEFTESDEDFVDKLTIHDGANGKVLGESPLARPRGLAVHKNQLYALHAEAEGKGSGFAVSSAAIKDGLPRAWKKVFAVPAKIDPADLEVDSHGRFYLSDSAADHVYQLDAAGAITRTFGKPGGQKPGSYDPEAFMAPGKLATWVAPDGGDRLLVVERAGPNRVSEWSADGKRLREFLTLQTKANDGWTVDPQNPDLVYILGHQGWLTRFRLDYAKRSWTVDAVWPNVGNDPASPGLKKPLLVRANGSLFLTNSVGLNVHRLSGDRWLLSAAVLRRTGAKPGEPNYDLWHDANGDGRVDDGEKTPSTGPIGMFSYHGQNWLEDLSLLAIEMGGRSVWRLAPSGFDAHGNPIFKEWKKTLTDPVFEARAAGKADAIHGGNELADRFTSDWFQADGSPAEGFYVQARGGKNFSANEGPQHAISRYVPDGAGGYKLKWRTGRTALEWLARTGEMYGAMRVRRPIHGLLSVIDQSRCGVLLYTEDGLYVDTIFPDSRRLARHAGGIYPQPGEFFAGIIYPHPVSGKIYFGFGKYTPLVFEAEGWSLTENPVRPLAAVQKTVSISASQIASPPEIALSLRGGAGTAPVARFGPALGGAALDGSLAGWESAAPVKFSADADRSAEVRLLYDPENLHLRWHARLGSKLQVQPLPQPERIFTHDRQADVLSFYIQGDPAAKSGGPSAGRPGDLRIVFGLAKEGDRTVPKAIGYYPEYTSKNASPQTFRTPVGQATFAHVGPVADAKLGYALDPDGKGFVLAATIPRSAIPRQSEPFRGGMKTLVDFEATFGGRHKFWWANSDGSASRETLDEPTEARLYPGAWAPAQFQALDGGVVVRNWQILGPFGGPGAEKFAPDPNGNFPGTDVEFKKVVQEFCEKLAPPPQGKPVDLSVEFRGPQVQGYWRDPGLVKWRPAVVADLDPRVTLGPSGQVWFGATWVHVPADAKLTFRFQEHHQTTLRWSVDGVPVRTSLVDKEKCLTTADVNLKAGWNEVAFRGYCVGYPPFRVGLVLDGPAETLWGLKLRGAPPAP